MHAIPHISPLYQFNLKTLCLQKLSPPPFPIYSPYSCNFLNPPFLFPPPYPFNLPTPSLQSPPFPNLSYPSNPPHPHLQSHPISSISTPYCASNLPHPIQSPHRHSNLPHLSIQFPSLYPSNIHYLTLTFLTYPSNFFHTSLQLPLHVPSISLTYPSNFPHLSLQSPSPTPPPSSFNLPHLFPSNLPHSKHIPPPHPFLPLLLPWFHPLPPNPLLTSSIPIGEIWESPDISQSYSISSTWQDEVQFTSPVASLLILIALIVSLHNLHLKLDMLDKVLKR